MTIDPKFIGKPYPSVTYQVSQEKIKEFVKATKGEIEKYSENIPLTFPVVYASNLLEQVLYDPELKLNLGKLVHGDMEFTYHKPAKAGDYITSYAWIDNIFSKKGHDFVIFKVDSKDANDELVCTQSSSFIVRGGNDTDFSFTEKLAMSLAGTASKLNFFPTEISALELDPEYKRVSDSEFKMKVYIDKYMPQKYAGASGDFNAIHLDSDLGKSVGLGSNILHGMATMALAANLGLHYFDQDSIKAFKARFSKPVKPGDELSFTLVKESDDTLVFLAKNQDGAYVIDKGSLSL
ncbi:MAG: MaoC family dehydratase N-terminal domain-containing protein [Candidatus Caenarcaniphilales bacterium]|nr:MaoC family dehydratase N-terminal domain-containing protein [Candidatus Caenarcaniphilales bacterium]